MTDVGVALVTTNCRADAERLLDELRAQTGVRLEIVVADNASSDGTREYLAEQRDVRLLANSANRWLSSAWAQGARASSAPYVLLLTPDTSLPPDTVSLLRDALDADPNAALAGPQLFDQNGVDLLNGAFAFPSVRWIVVSELGLGRLLGLHGRPPAAVEAGGDDLAPRPVPIVNGACMLVRRSSLEAIGGLDERYRLYWEEVDLARRLRDAGFRVLLVPRARVMHRQKGTPMLTGLRRQTWEHGERLYLTKHHGRAAFLAVRAARAVGGVRARRKERPSAAAEQQA